MQDKELVRIQRDLAVALNGESQLDAALSLCFDTALEVSGMDAGGIYLFDSAGGLDLAVHGGHSVTFIEAVGYMEPGSPEVEMVHRGEPVYVRVAELPESVRKPFEDEGLRSFAALPICHLGESIACMTLSSRELQELPEAVRNPLEGIAAILGGAIARLEAETLCREGRDTLSALLDANAESVFLLDLKGAVMVANQTLAERLNTTVAELVGQPIARFASPAASELTRAHCQKVIETGKPESRLDEWGGRHFHRRIHPILDESGKVVLLACFVADITERRLAEQKIEAEQRLLRELLDLQEKERKLISHELHDGFVQDIVGAQMLLDAAVGQAEAKDTVSYQEVNAARQLLQEAIAEARRMIRDLRPVIIREETGVIGALHDMVAQEEKPGDLEIRFEHDVRFKRLDPMLEGTIFRIVHEALVNVRKHSGSSTVAIRLTEPDDLLLEIEDRGRGFDVSQVSPDRFGVRGIRERARLFGGQATIESQLGGGTRIAVVLPVRREEVVAERSWELVETGREESSTTIDNTDREIS